MSWWDNVLAGTAGAPWLWWAVALVALIAVLLGAMKLFGLLPE